LRSTVTARDADFDTVLVPWQGEEPAATIEDIAVEADGAVAVRPAHAQRITLANSVDTWFHARGATARCWRIGDFEFSGRWVHWREAADGRVLNAVSHAGARLVDRRGGAPVVLDTEEPA
jgi:hypothetical protein